jgi:hypothetical protein
VFRKQFQGKPSSTFQVNGFFEANGAVQAAEIVDALTAATRLEDLADAFAWYEAALPAQVAQVMLDCIRQRTTLVHGCTIPQGSIPDSTRAINTEVALMMFDAVKLAFDIRLTGLRTAAHLNDREGVIRGPDPANVKRWTARLDDGTCVSVKSENFVHIRRGDYKRVSP